MTSLLTFPKLQPHEDTDYIDTDINGRPESKEARHCQADQNRDSFGLILGSSACNFADIRLAKSYMRYS